jgi:hypothetical protein
MSTDYRFVLSGVLLGMSRTVREREFERDGRPSETRRPQPCYQCSRPYARRPERMTLPCLLLLPLIH